MKNYQQKNLGLLSVSLIIGLLSGCGGGGGSTADTTTYTVGGSVSGLSGSGLVLQNNGGDSLTVNADGNFTFATALTDAENYAVTVSSSPTAPAQTCSVTNDTGTISAANITDVSVACVDVPDTTAPTISNTTPANDATNVERNATFSATFNEDMIASTVNGTNITLSDGSNVAGAVSFDAMTNVATFTPTNELALLRNYTANLNANITDLSGNALANTNVSFTTRDGAWGTEALIETDNAGDTVDPQIVADANGNAFAIWQRFDGSTRYDIMANRYVAGTGWGTAELVETSDLDARGPQIAVDLEGNAFAIWKQSDGAQISIYASRYVVGTGWGTADLIETDNLGGAQDQEIAVDDSGNAMAVWAQSDGTRFNIWANRYVVGAGWGTAELIETVDVVSAGSPQVVIDSNGTATAVWFYNRDIYANRYVVGTGWGTAEVIESNNIGQARYPDIGIDDAGNVIAVWYQNDGITQSIYANRYVVGTGWGTAELIETSSESAQDVRIAVTASGNAIAVWAYGDYIGSNTYTVGTGWGTPTNAYVVSTSLDSVGLPVVAIGNDGNAIAVWEKYVDSTGLYDIWANRYVAGSGSGWGTATVIKSGAGNAEGPQVAVGADGSAIAVWFQSDGTRDNIMANRFE